MEDDIVGRRYVVTGSPSITWVVANIVQKDMEAPHAVLARSDDPRTTKLIAVNALKDERLYRKVG